MKAWLIVVQLIIASIAPPAMAGEMVDDRFAETRYCGPPQRTKSGKIKRDPAVLREFERLYPLPPGSDRSKWQLDHVLPLSEGGCDAVRNLQWLPVSIKTCSRDDCKDRWERSGIYSHKPEPGAK